MKGKKFLALLCCGVMALSIFAGCGDNKDEKKEGGDAKTETKADPTDPAGYYQFSYDAEGLGLWVNYIHLYEESSIGKVFYAGYASNQITMAGTYEIEKKSCDYAVCMTRADQEADPKKMTEGTADYTITFKSFDGTELGSCGYDGEYIYNDTEGVAGTGAENCAFAKDAEGMDSKYGQADSGYQGEKGIAYLKAYLESDETCSVSLNHDGTYSDMMTVEIVGKWEQGEDGKTYTLTPDSDSDTAATLVIADDGASATYTPEGGEAATLKIDQTKPVSLKFSAVIPADSNGTGADVDCWINCYGDKSCEVFISAFGVELALDKGTYETDADANTTFHFETAGDIVSVAGDDGMEVPFKFTGAPGVGDIDVTLVQDAE